MDTEIEVSIEGVSTNQWSLFGVRESNSKKHIQVFWPLSSTQYRVNFSDKYQANTRRTVKTKCTLKLNKSGFWIDSTQTASFQSPIAHVTFPGNLWLFALNNNGNIEGGANLGLEHGQVPYKIYYVKIRENNTLVRDFRPAKCGNEAGMVDLVSNTFYHNQVSQAPFYVHNISTKAIDMSTAVFDYDDAYYGEFTTHDGYADGKRITLDGTGFFLIKVQNIVPLDYAEQPFTLPDEFLLKITSSLPKDGNSKNMYALMNASNAEEVKQLSTGNEVYSWLNRKYNNHADGIKIVAGTSGEWGVTNMSSTSKIEDG
jgi:hypothetical protein